ncbi:helix-turn-helix domain-containing protein [Mesorhizobium sp. M0136]|uniref:helix-turn-helix domain-containing protein n=1 Tax=Mesorhizobium sp. M0136 TaxID=2956890 RepID=UPI003336459A
MEVGENNSELAREAGISRQRLYDWRDRLRLTGSVKARRRGRPGKASVVSSEPLQQSGEMAPPPEERRSPRRDGASPNWNRKSASSNRSRFFSRSLAAYQGRSPAGHRA